MSDENQKDTEERKDETNNENQQQTESQSETEETNENSSAEQIHTTDEDRKEVNSESYGEKRPWATQADQSDKEKERRAEHGEVERLQSDDIEQHTEEYDWKLCNATTGPDYIPCLDNLKAIKKLRPENYRHYEHRERHCPEEAPTCLVPLPKGYRRSVEWPKSRDRVIIIFLSWIDVVLSSLVSLMIIVSISLYADLVQQCASY